MALVKAVDGKIRLIDNTDSILFENSSTAAALTVSAGAGKFGYGQTQANQISLAVKKLVTIVKNAKLAT